ncbi:MAG: 16S rRNA (guanine(527)-N(7))-methyltransferase RsmG [Clostridia bacterium]|nr:16S rRNA (guanine(527)-N(7))-methyltransferase RsmG [Clostridia bacterium]
MEYSEFYQIFTSGLQNNTISPLSDTQIEQFYRFSIHLLSVNQTTNLTAIRSLPDVIDKHLIDSLLIAEQIPSNARVLDLGCGPGFPSIPLAIARPDLSIVALDSTAKKIAFVNEAAANIGLSNLQAIAGRAEDHAISQKLGQFDAVVSRAVARLNILCELCIPYIKIGGVLLAMKGAKAEEELAEAKRAIQTLGGSIVECADKPLIASGGCEEARTTIKITKRKPTPAVYPRAYAAILKKPL